MMKFQGSRSLKWLTCLAAILLTACAAPTRTEVSIESGTHAIQATRDAVVLFPMYVEHGHGATTADAQPKREHQGAGEADFMRCLKRELERNMSGQVKLVDAATFQEALFPWFEREHAPSSLRELEALLARAEVRKRIASLGVRYLVNIAGSAESDGFPGMICGGGYGGAGCLGLAWENKTQRVNAVIWDVVQGSQSGALSTTTSGRSVFIGYVIPIMFIAETERDACTALAAELGRLLVDTTDAATSGQ
jgi:hypothetical protein